MRFGIRLLLTAFLLGAIILPIADTSAQQDVPTEELILVYNNLEDDLVVLDARSGTITDLVTADDTRRYEYELALSPTNEHVAVYTLSFDKGAINRAEYFTFTYTLDIFSLPDGEKVYNTSLIPESYVFRTGAEEANVEGNPTYELPESFGEMAWSPDGSTLAYVAGVDGGDANVFLFDAASGSVSALTDVDGYPSELRWSPDGSQLAFMSVDTFLATIGRSGGEIYVIDVKEDTVVAEISSDTELTWLVDWVDDESILWSPFDLRGGANGIFLYDTASEESGAVLEGDQPMSVPTYDNETGSLGFAVPLLNRDEEGVTQAGLAPGAYVIDSIGDDPELLSDADNIYGVNYVLPDYLNVGNDNIVRVSDRTEFFLEELRQPNFSPDGTYAVGTRDSWTYLRNLSTTEEDLVVQLYYVSGEWLDNETFIAKVGAYGSVVGIGSVNGTFVNLVNDVGNGPFRGFRPN